MVGWHTAVTPLSLFLGAIRVWPLSLPCGDHVQSDVAFLRFQAHCYIYSTEHLFSPFTRYLSFASASIQEIARDSRRRNTCSQRGSSKLFGSSDSKVRG